jgi:hypothetical protein
MTPMEALLESLRPTSKPSVYSILQGLGWDMSGWEMKKSTRKPSQHPKSYGWSYENPKKSVALCIWHTSITDNGHTLIEPNNLRTEPVSDSPIKASIWKRRAGVVDKHIQSAYLNKLPIHVIVLSGLQRDRTDPFAESSKVKFRRLDTIRWAVAEYDFESGDYLLVRGMKPVEPFGGTHDPEAAGYKEGALRQAFRAHRHREWRARRDKIADVLAKAGKLVCEVPGCEFDFEARYGSLGTGYAHVHHLEPLGSTPAKVRETKLSDLAIVCPNCHAMIHLGGECRNMKDLIAT